jgi:hypothetical protein
MSTITVRISARSRNILRELAEREEVAMQAILDKAIESYRRQLFLEQVNKAYAMLREDATAWPQILKERAAWDTTLSDGLENAKGSAENRKANPKKKTRRVQRG